MSGEEVRPPSFAEELCRRLHVTRWEFSKPYGACDECKTYVLAVIESDWLAADRESRTVFGTTVTEWGLKWASGEVTSCGYMDGVSEDFARGAMRPSPHRVAQVFPDAIVSRQRTSYPDHVTDWEPTAAPTTEATS